ncbi:MAG: DUF523 domain-containing protein [Halanaerobiales bacterium]|nr:DUF523 domain-containing protein [Halanaerobiales bacterium]
MYLVSACLLGVNSRYDGNNNFNQKLYELFKNALLYPVCPEIMGGLKTPRDPCEIVSQNNEFKVINIKGENKTEQFKRGAHNTLKIAQILKAEGAIFMERSPSCGVYNIYDGSFNKKLIKGEGVTSGLLKENGFKLFTIKDLDKISV